MTGFCPKKKGLYPQRAIGPSEAVGNELQTLKFIFNSPNKSYTMKKNFF